MSGNQISENGVELSFDFARTTSENGQMKSFYVVPGDGASQIVANADETAEIRYHLHDSWIIHCLLGRNR